MSKEKYPDLKIGDVIGKWTIIGEAPKRSYANTTIKYWTCQCSCDNHTIREVNSALLKRGLSKSCGCKSKKSGTPRNINSNADTFYDWCIKNNHQDFLERWDNELNQLSPSDVGFASHKWIYFKCSSNKHNSTKIQPSTITHNSKNPRIRCKYCDSFAQRFLDKYGENALDIYWDFEKNTKDPWELPGSSKMKYVWIKCVNTDYHGSFYRSIDGVIAGGITCPYCINRIIHPKDSFGQYLINRYGEDNFKKIWNNEQNTIDPFTIAPSIRSHKVYLNCIKNDHHLPSFVYPNDVKNQEYYCKYCSRNNTEYMDENESLGFIYKDSINVWSDKNTKTPFQFYPNSNIKVWWKCQNNKHEEYKRSICDAVRYGFRCYQCTQEKNTSFYQDNVNDYLTSELNYNVLHEHKCNLKPINPKTGFYLLYDNEIEELKLIIEVHGPQHYGICGLTEMAAKTQCLTLEEAFNYQKWKDEYKKEYALNNGYCYLEIPYWKIRSGKFKNMIDNKINEIIKRTT